jgi:uncharacterized cupredoxin-like copper-binding protein
MANRRPSARGLFRRGNGARRISRAIFAAAALGLATIGACSPSPEANGTPVDLTLHDFHITPSSDTVAGSDVVFQVHNAAPATHEFVVVPTDLPPDALPLAPDGISVDEDAFHTAGEISEVPAGTTATLELHLPPGRYVFFCNLEGHYLGGMHGALQVTGPGQVSSTSWPGASG